MILLNRYVAVRRSYPTGTGQLVITIVDCQSFTVDSRRSSVPNAGIKLRKWLGVLVRVVWLLGKWYLRWKVGHG